MNSPIQSPTNQALLTQKGYQLGRVIARNTSTQTEIFEVEHRRHQTQLVMKVLPDHSQNSTTDNTNKLVELFQREARALQELNVPGIAKLYEYFILKHPEESRQLHCLVIERINGYNLREWIERTHPIDPNTAIVWLRKLANILKTVHQRDLMHRDIKPSNIMRKNHDKDLVLIDFGAVREVTETVIKGQDHTIVLSYGYTAPEQIQGQSEPRSDFFSLGRTFVYLLTGKHPTNLECPDTGELDWRSSVPHISQKLADLIDDLMAHSPDERPKNVQAILERLDELESPSIRTHTLQPTPPTLLHSKSIWQRLQELLTQPSVRISGLVVCGAMGFAIWYFWPKPPQNCFLTEVPNVPQGTFKTGGSTTWAPIRPIVDVAIGKAKPEFHLGYATVGGSADGLRILLAGQMDFAQSSRPFLPQENQQARQLGFSLVEESVAYDAISVAVNPQLKIPGLTLDQLRDIYTGKIRNWQALGGYNQPITPYSRQREDSGTVEFFVDYVLKGQPFRSDVVKSVDRTTEGISKVADDLGGIYFASAREIVPQSRIRPLPLANNGTAFIAPYQEPYQSRQLNLKAFAEQQYPLTRKIFVIVKHYEGENKIEEQAGKAYTKLLLTNQGQQLLEKAGFAPIHMLNKSCPSS